MYFVLFSQIDFIDCLANALTSGNRNIEIKNRYSSYKLLALFPPFNSAACPGIGRFSAEGFALCAYTVQVSAKCFGKTTFCLTNCFVQQPDNSAPGSFLEWSTYWPITSQNLLRSARIFIDGMPVFFLPYCGGAIKIFEMGILVQDLC
jgi:hypothetical protein